MTSPAAPKRPPGRSDPIGEWLPHPLSIVYRLRRYTPLFLLPLVPLVAHGPTVWQRFSLGELLLFAVLCGCACFWRKMQSLRLSETALWWKRGWLWRRHSTLPFAHIASLTVTRTPLMALTAARRLSVTEDGRLSRPSLTFLLPAAVLKQRYSLPRRRPILFTRWFPLLILSATSSNAALGLLTLIPVARNAARLLGNTLPNQILGTVEQAVFPGLSPLLTLIADGLLFGWLMAFFRGLWYYAGFSLCRRGRWLVLTTGLITRQDSFFSVSHVKALEIHGTLLTALLRLRTVLLCVNGYTGRSAVRPVLLPAVQKRQLSARLAALFPEITRPSIALRPVSGAALRYTALPLAVIGAGLAVSLLGGFLTPLGNAVCLWGGWWLLLRRWGFSRAGVGGNGDTLALCFLRRGHVVWRYIPLRELTKITVKQSRFQRWRGTCTLTVRDAGGGTSRLWSLPYEALRRWEAGGPLLCEML